jgi:hypothetical protein
VAVFISTPTRRVCDVCCACSAIGQVAAAPPRRVIGPWPRMSAPGQGSRSDQTITLEGVWYLLQRMSALGQKQTSDCCALMSALPPKADIGGDGCDVRFVPKADIRVIGWGGKEPGGRHLFGVVKDDSDGVTHPGTNAAHAVPKVDAIRSFRPFYRPVMHGERNCITLLQWHHFHAALHTWPLF